MKVPVKREIRTYKSDEDMVVFELLEGKRKLRSVYTFGYGCCHGLWFRIRHHRPGLMSLTPQVESVVKEKIAHWGRAEN